MASSTDNKIHVIVVAAGIGRRFSEEHAATEATPKQYQMIGNSTVLAHSIKAFNAANVTGITVVLHPKDRHWNEQPKIISKHPIHTTVGGEQRHDSVRNGIKSLHADKQDWVLVHDAARPCVSQIEIQSLIDACTNQQQGGLLVMPVSDTIKCSKGRLTVDKTLDRSHMYAALTPQMFRCGDLLKALTVFEAGSITDESSALEAQGQQPIMVLGKSSNIKITAFEDLPIAAAILQLQGRL